MTKQKSTKRALLMSGIALLMCVSMLVGTTYAWFTDTASTAVNKIQSGTLDVALEMYDGEKWVDAEGETLDFVKAEGHENEEILWEPGCTYELPALRIRNNGNLALKYEVIITGLDGDAKLSEAIDWYYSIDLASTALGGYGWTTPTDAYRLENFGEEDYLLPKGQTENIRTDSSVFKIIGKMREDAGNEYQNLTIDGIGITVVATQYTYESDSYNSLYDKDATLPSFWDGKVGEVPEPNAANERHITSAAELAAIMAATTKGNSNSLYGGETLVLDCDIDFGGRTISGIGGYRDNVVFTFDGNGHTISNFVINGKDDAHKEPQADGSIEYRYAGLFQQFNGTVKDLTVRNATIIGDQMVGVIAANVDKGGKIENCKVYDSVVIGAKKVGAIAGYIAGAGCEISGCYAENVEVYASDARTEQSAKMIGYVGDGSTTNNKEPVNVNVYRGVTPVLVSTADELEAALADPTNGGGQPARTIIITKDLDMSDWTAMATASNYPSVTIEGQGHTLKNLSAPLFKNVPGRNYTFSDITVDGATIATGKDGFGAAFVGEFQNNGGGKITIDNCHVKNATISAYKYAGAFVGYAADGGAIEITDCTVSDTSLETEDSSCGAFVGHTSTNTTITNGKILGSTNVKCAENRNDGKAKAGWFIGTIQGSTTISNCTNESTGTLTNINAQDPINGGFVGRNESGSITVD